MTVSHYQFVYMDKYIASLVQIRMLFFVLSTNSFVFTTAQNGWHRFNHSSQCCALVTSGSPFERLPNVLQIAVGTGAHRVTYILARVESR
jgi:hypothetical protein